ncbi:MAG: hypothetical protein WCT20_01800 [Candidatus Babeliales bacterium]
MIKVGRLGGIVAMSVCLSSCSLTVVDREVKKGDELFARWIASQKVFDDISPSSMKFLVDDGYAVHFKKRYQGNKDHLASNSTILSSMFNCSFDFQLDLVDIHNSTLVNTIGHVTALLERDMEGFIQYLRDIGLTSPAQQEHDKALPNDTSKKYKELIKQYNGLLQLFFLNGDAGSDEELVYLRAVANRMFEYAFGPGTWPQFHTILLTPSDHPIARVFYAAIWYYLAGSGWKQWHRQCLDALKRDYEKGKRIVYIAGGSDVYQLIKHGIYSIDLIDPILPTQPRYYSEGWAWLVRDGGIGDEIIFTFQDRTIVARRTSCTKHGFFSAKLSIGEWGDVPSSVTTWTLSDKKSRKRLGTWVIHRRCATQADFVADDSRSLVISFNELYFVATQNPIKSWGINPALFDDHFTMHVKQLRHSVTKEMIKNMAEADASAFSFIALGSEIN